MTGLLTKLRFLLRWGLFYNLELMWLQLRAPGSAKRPGRTPALPESPELDARRRRAQLAVYQVTQAYGDVCAGCGNCCRERTDRFTVMDAAVRSKTARPAPSFGTRLLSPVWEVWNTARHTAIRLASLGRPRQAMGRCEVCPNLTPTGCGLALDERPMICATWFCPKLMWAMKPKDLLQITPPLREVEQIQRQAVAGLRSVDTK